jgi:ATP-dependent DNA helicase RecG
MNEQAASLTEFLRRTITPKVLYDVSFDETAGGDVIAASFRDGQLSRESKPRYPFNSLREGLVNALVHRDYAAFSGGVSVSVYTERVGRGTYKIGQECRDFGMRPPEWKNAGAGVRLTLFAAGVGIPAINLNNRQQELLATLVYGEAIRVPQYVERFGQGITDRQARRDLSDLENAGFLARHGAGSKTTYERTEKAL